MLLFDRVGRRLQLTSEGEDIVRRGRRLLQEADSCATARRDQGRAYRDAGVGGSPQNIETVLAPFVTRFRRKHPGIEVHFVEDGGRASMTGSRRARAIVLTTVDNELFFSRLLFPAYALAVVAPSHPLGRRSSVEVSELADGLSCSCTAGSARAAGSTPLVIMRTSVRQSFWKAAPRIP